MNKTLQYSSSVSEPWSRRVSVESILSIQGKETDFVRDSTDTEYSEYGQELEYEPCSEPEADDDAPALGDSSGESDNEIIATKVIAVSVRDDGDLEFADSEQTDTDGFDSEVDLCDYWNCAQCGANNNNPIYRYCERCFKVRKNFFPPRPKRKNKPKSKKDPEDSRPLSQDSVIDAETDRLHSLSQENDREHNMPSLLSQSDNLEIEWSESPLDMYIGEQPRLLASISTRTNLQDSVHVLSKSLDKQVQDQARSLSQDSGFDSQELTDPTPSTSGLTAEIKTVISEVRLSSNTNKERPLKRRSGSVDRKPKRIRLDFSSESDSDSDVKVVSPLVKTISDPSLSVEDLKVNKKMLSDTAKEIDKDNNMCIVCLSEPKSGVFVHGRIAHICCCYKCAVKVWAKAKRCPVCNCKVSNVLRAVVM